MPTRFALMFLCLTLALTVHELGHYLAGRVFNTKIKSFNIFASPGFHLFSTHDKWFLRLFPAMASRVEVKVGWLPLLAYVRFEDKPSDDAVDRRYLPCKPAWQRLIIYSAGVMINFLSAVAIDTTLRQNYFPQENIARSAWTSTKAMSQLTLNMATGLLGDLSDQGSRIFSITDNHDSPSPRQTDVKASDASQKGGYYRLASRFPEDLQFMRLAWLFCGISIGLVVFNLLPVPPLDGGQILFAAYECIARRPPNQHFQIIITLIGLAVLVISMVYMLVDEIIKDI